MITDNKPNDFVAASINSMGQLTLDDLRSFNLTPDNTGIKDADYYKNIPQVKELFIGNDNKFDEQKYNQWYNDTLDLYNSWSTEDYESRLIDAIETSPYDIFSLGNTNVRDTSAEIISVHDPERHSSGLANIYEYGTPTFDVREVAQDNFVRDENGNKLDWKPNDKLFLKALFRPAIALAAWDEDGTHMENGRVVEHRKGDLKFDENGDPYTELLGNRDASNKEVIHFWDTITRDDSIANKFDFLDNDGLTKSVGGTIMKTAVSLAPFFIPGVNVAAGWIGASFALAKTLPMLGKAIDSIFTGTDENNFGKALTSFENYFNRFDNSTSREGMNKFFSFENVGQMIVDSAGQLFQQRNIINASQKWLKLADKQKAQKVGSAIALGYMAATSAQDTYSTFKNAGVNDRMAGIATLGVMAGLYGLMQSGYIFKDAMFKDTWLAEDQNFRNVMKTLAEANMAKNEAELAKIGEVALINSKKSLMNNVALFKKAKDLTMNFFGKSKREFQNAIANGSILDVEVAQQSWWQSLLSRGLNEGIEEVMEETVTDTFKGITKGLEALGVNVSKDDEKIDYGETWSDFIQRYATTFAGGAIGGVVFDSFNQYENLINRKNNKINRNVISNLTAYMSDPQYKKQVYDYIDKMEKKQLLGDKNLSAKGETITNEDGSTKVVFREGTSENNRNLLAANTLRRLVGSIEQDLKANGLEVIKDNIRLNIMNSLNEKASNLGLSLEQYCEQNGIDINKEVYKAKGFVDAIYTDLTKSAADIITISTAINNKKAEISSKFTDTQKNEREEAIKNNQELKDLNDRLKDAKAHYDEVYSGKYNDFYLALTDFSSDSWKLGAYINNPLVGSDAKPLNKENYVLYKKGLEYDKLSQAEKDAIDSEWDSFVNSDALGEKIRKAFYIHYNLSDQMSDDFRKVDEKLNNWNPTRSFEDEINVYVETIDNAINDALSSSVGAENIQQISRIKDSIDVFKNLEKEENESESDYLNRKAKHVSDLFNYMLNGNALNIHQKIKFIQNYYNTYSRDKVFIKDKTLLSNTLTYLSQIISKCLNWNVGNEDAENQMNLYAVANQKKVESSFDHAKSNLYNNSKEYLDLFRAFYNLSDNASYSEILDTYLTQKEIKDIKDFFSGVEESSFDGYFDSGYAPADVSKDRMANALHAFNEFESRNNLAASVNNDQIVKDLLTSLQSALKNQNYVEINNIINKIFKVFDGEVKDANGNTITIDEDKSEQFIVDLFSSYENKQVYSSINPEDLNNIQGLLNNVNKFLINPVYDLLNKVNSYVNGKLNYPFNIYLEQLKAFESFGSEAEEQFTISDERSEAALKEVDNVLNVLGALLNSTVDGSNSKINIFRKDNQLKEFAEISENSRNIISEEFSWIKEKIKEMINVSNKNKNKQINNQRDTAINCDPKLVRKVIELVDLADANEKDDDKINANEILKSILANRGVDIDNSKVANFAEVKGAIIEFWEELYKKIDEKYKTEENKVDFYKKIINNASTIFTLASTAFSRDTQISEITEFTAFQHLVNNTIENPAKIDYIYNEAGKSDDLKNIIPFFSQEFIIKSALIQYAHADSINELLQAIKEDIKTNKKFENYYKDNLEEQRKTFNDKQVLWNWCHIDGTAGAGKTEITKYITECIKLYNKNANIYYTSKYAYNTDNNLQPRLGFDDNHKKDLYELIKTILGEEITDDEKYYERSENGWWKLGSEKLNLLTERLTKLSNNEFTDDFKRGDVLVIDEDGLLDNVWIEILYRWAKERGVTIIGTGDTTQFGATIKGMKIGLTEDFFGWYSPILTISMRSNNNGKAKNQNAVFERLSEIRKLIYEDPNVENQTLNDKTKELFNDGNPLTLINYRDNNDFYGDLFVEENEIANIITKIKSIVSNLNSKDSNKNHKLLIVVDPGKESKYDSIKDDNVIVTTSQQIQGGQADYVIVDRTQWGDLSYNMVRDFYTMMTRSKNSTIFVKGDYLDNLHITTVSTDSASFRLTDEEFKKSVDIYKEWKNNLPTYSYDPSQDESTEDNKDDSKKENSSEPQNPQPFNGELPKDPTKEIYVNDPEIGKEENNENELNQEINDKQESIDNFVNPEQQNNDQVFINNNLFFNFLDGLKNQEIENWSPYFKDLINVQDNVSDEESKKWQKIDCVSFIKLFSKAFWAKIYNGKIFEKVDDPRLKFNINNTYSHKMKVLSESFEEDNTYVSKLFEQFNSGEGTVEEETLSFDINGKSIKGSILLYCFNTQKGLKKIPIGITNYDISDSNHINIKLSDLKEGVSLKNSSNEISSEINKGDIISSKGKIRKKLSDVFDINLLPTSLSICVNPYKSEDNWLQHFDESGDLNNGTIKFLLTNIGKSFINLQEDPSIDIEDDLIPEESNGLISYLCNRSLQNIGVQRIVGFKQFLEICKAKHDIYVSLANDNALDLESKAKEKLSEYFGSDYVNDVVNALKNVETSTSNESEKSKAAALKDLGKLSVLNSSSTYKLLSAIYRFFQTRDNDKSTFFQNLFNIGINNVPLNKTTKTTQNGLSIVFKDDNGFDTYLTLLFDKENQKYNIYLHGSKYGSDCQKIEKDINVFTMSDIKNPETILNAVKNVIINIDDKVANTQDIKRDLNSRNILDLFKEGIISIGVSTSVTPTGETTKIYPAFDNVVGSIFGEGQFSNKTIDELDEFLRSDSIFKYEMFANIVGMQINGNDFWKQHSLENNEIDNFSTDIIKVFENVYQFGIKRNEPYNPNENQNQQQNQEVVNNPTIVNQVNINKDDLVVRQFVDDNYKMYYFKQDNNIDHIESINGVNVIYYKDGTKENVDNNIINELDKYAIDNKLDDIVIFVYSKGLSTRINEIINNPKYKWFDEKLNEINKMTLQNQINYINDLFEQFADKEFEILYSIDNNNYSINEYYKNVYEARKFLYNSLNKNNEKIKSIELEHDNGDNIDFVVTFNDGKINKCNVFKDNNKWKIATMQEDSSSNQNDYLQNFKNEIQIVNDYFDKQTDVRIKWLQNDLSNKVAEWFERINENREVITKEDKQWFGRLFVAYSKEEWFVHLKNAMKIIQDQQNKGCLI